MLIFKSKEFKNLYKDFGSYFKLIENLPSYQILAMNQFDILKTYVLGNKPLITV